MISLIKMASKIVVLCCLLAVANAGPRASNWMPALTPTFGLRVQHLESRIVGGDDAKVGEFPHQVSLQMVKFGVLTHFCGGSIISEKWILTAGHCVFGTGGAPITVKAGKHNINAEEDSEQRVAVEEYFVHEDYIGNVAPFDIALLKLETPLKFNKRVAPIRLPHKSGVEPAGDATVSGWGWISTTLEPIRPAILQKVTVPIIDRKPCNASIESISFGEPSKLHVTNICTGPLNGGLGACKGDSGGPLIAKNTYGANELIGVVSWGFVPCGAAGAPSVFVKVSDFLDWISLTITENDRK